MALTRAFEWDVSVAYVYAAYICKQLIMSSYKTYHEQKCLRKNIFSEVFFCWQRSVIILCLLFESSYCHNLFDVGWREPLRIAKGCKLFYLKIFPPSTLFKANCNPVKIFSTKKIGENVWKLKIPFIIALKSVAEQTYDKGLCNEINLHSHCVFPMCLFKFKFSSETHCALFEVD